MPDLLSTFFFKYFNLYISFSLIATQRERNVPKERENTQLFSISSLCSAMFKIFGYTESLTLATVTSWHARGAFSQSYVVWAYLSNNNIDVRQCLTCFLYFSPSLTFTPPSITKWANNVCERTTCPALFERSEFAGLNSSITIVVRM